MGFGCGRDAGCNDAVSGIFKMDYSELGLFSSYKQLWLPAVTSLAGKITIKKAQGGKGKGRQRTAAGDSTTGRGRAEQEQVHRVERAFSCSFPFRCQIALQQREQNATRPPGSPSWSSTRLTERRRAGAMLQLVQSTSFISLQLLLIDVTQSPWISFVSLLRSWAAAPRPAKKETRQKPCLEVALFMTAERWTLT